MRPVLDQAFFEALRRDWGPDAYEREQALLWEQIWHKETGQSPPSDKDSPLGWKHCFVGSRVPAYTAGVLERGERQQAPDRERLDDGGGWRIASEVEAAAGATGWGAACLEALEGGADVLHLRGEMPTAEELGRESREIAWHAVGMDVRAWDWEVWLERLSEHEGSFAWEVQGDLWGSSALLDSDNEQVWQNRLRQAVRAAHQWKTRMPGASPVLLSALPLAGLLGSTEKVAVLLAMAKQWLEAWENASKEAPVSGPQQSAKDLSPSLCFEWASGSLWLEEASLHSVLRRAGSYLCSNKAPVKYWSAWYSEAPGSDPEVSDGGGYKALLRMTTSALSAVFGGADTVFLPHLKGSLQGVDPEGARRLPRNLQLLLRNEAGLAKSRDLATGAPVFHALEERALEEVCLILDQMEEAGGLWTWFRRRRSGQDASVDPCSTTNPFWQSVKLAVLEGIRSVTPALYRGWESGVPPFLRGPYASMYLQRPWTIRQYAGFSTAAASNAFYKRNLAGGQKGLSVAFDLPTHRGYDSDHPRAQADVGKAGVAIDSVEDMKLLFQDLPLDRLSVSMTMNGAVVPVLAFFVVAAEESGVPSEQLTGTIQNDILKEFMVRNTYIYPPRASMKLIAEIFRFCSDRMPRFNSISISGYHMHEAGAPADLELAYTLADGMEYLRAGLEAGLHLDDFAPRLSFFWATGMDYVTEIAKLRAGRLLWARITRAFGARSHKAMALRTHCQTSGWSLTQQDPYNNVVRTCLEAMAAVLGGTQSLHTNALDEALALPTDYSAKIARETQIYLQQDAGICSWVDPLGGSLLLEQRTRELVMQALDRLEEIEAAGGMTKALETSLPKRRVEEAAAVKQGRIDTGQDVVVGVNAYRLPPSAAATDISLLQVDHEEVLGQQQAALGRLRARRDAEAVVRSLEGLRKAARAIQKDLNEPSETEHARGRAYGLMEQAVEAARCRATLGEISGVLEEVFGRHQAQSFTIQGVYARQVMQDSLFEAAREAVQVFEGREGRRPRILIAKLGQDGHDRGAKIIASGFADLGFDVDLGPLFQSPEECARQAVENDVHWVGVSSLAAGHLTLIPALREALNQQGASSIRVVVGGVIPPQDHEVLRSHGVQAIFGPGTRLSEAALQILNS